MKNSTIPSNGNSTSPAPIDVERRSAEETLSARFRRAAAEVALADLPKTINTLKQEITALRGDILTLNANLRYLTNTMLQGRRGAA